MSIVVLRQGQEMTLKSELELKAGDNVQISEAVGKLTLEIIGDDILVILAGSESFLLRGAVSLLEASELSLEVNQLPYVLINREGRKTLLSQDNVDFNPDDYEAPSVGPDTGIELPTIHPDFDLPAVTAENIDQYFPILK